MLLGCVQPAMMPNINAATTRVLDAAGIQTLVADGAGCCGAIRTHLNDIAGGLNDMRRNIDAWWPLVEGLTPFGKVEAIVMNASGCGVTVKDYGHALAQDASYAHKAERISALTKDLSELLPDMVVPLKPKVRPSKVMRLAYHPPCTLQHGQQLRGGVEAHLESLGFQVGVAVSDSHLCCGSAGTYSVLQPKLAYELRDRKLGNLAPLQPQAIVSANMGYGHLRAIFPLQEIAHGEAVTLGENDDSTPREKRLWGKMLALYTRFSRAKGIPGIGKKTAARMCLELKDKVRQLVPHESLRAGDACPKCITGKVYEHAPRTVVKVTGQPPLVATVFKISQLRCRMCEAIFAAAGIANNSTNRGSGWFTTALPATRSRRRFSRSGSSRNSCATRSGSCRPAIAPTRRKISDKPAQRATSGFTGYVGCRPIKHRPPNTCGQRESLTSNLRSAASQPAG
jgi:hypothetical protein